MLTIDTIGKVTVGGTIDEVVVTKSTTLNVQGTIKKLEVSQGQVVDISGSGRVLEIPIDSQVAFEGQKELEEIMKSAYALSPEDYTTESYNWLKTALEFPVTSNAEVKAKTEAIKQVLSILEFAGQSALDTKKAQAEKKKEADYTSESYSPLKLALELPETTNAEVIAKTEAIQEALTGLEFAGQSALNTAKAIAEEKQESDYTFESYSPLKAALELPETTNAEVVAKTEAIQEALAGLEFTGQTALNAAKAKAEEKEESDFTSESYGPLKAALELPETTNAEVVAKTEAIEEALAGLEFAGQTTLNAAKAKAEEKEEADYTSESYSLLKAALELPETTNGEVVAKTEAIQNALANLEFAGQSALNAAKTKANEKQEADYTSESYNALKSTLELTETTNGEVVAKTEAIQSALANLEFAGQSALNAAKTKADEKQEADYTSESFNALKSALELTETTNGEVVAKTEAIQSALAGLEFIGQTALNAAKAKAEKKKEADYTSESYSPLKAALELPETTNAEVVAKTEAIQEALAGLEFAGQSALYAAKAKAKEKEEADYTTESFNALKLAMEMSEATNAEMVAKTEAINEAIAELIFADQSLLDSVKSQVDQLIKEHYSQESFNSIINALNLPETTNDEVIVKTQAIQDALNNLKVLVSSVGSSNTIIVGKAGNAPEDVKGSLPAQAQVTLANGLTRMIDITSWTDNDQYDPAASGSYTFTAIVAVPADVDLNGHSITIEVVVEEAPVHSSVESQMLTSLDFSTVAATTAKLDSKPVTVDNFTNNAKSFTIVYGQDRIPVNVYWQLSTDFSRGAAMGSVVESAIQDYYFKKGGSNGIMTRPLYAMGFGDTFFIQSFKTGSASSIILEGNDWDYFFDENRSIGKDQDTSKNRSFTVSVGEKTSTIQLTGNFTSIDQIITLINSKLSTDGVQATAEKMNITQFKITSQVSGSDIFIGGNDKDKLFQ
ncbi:Ig-like domain-containing protein [Cytobacillus gottheilii]|uniref:Ig-like domain-containing protein n=1 Tax=Cytobacillus gottheilii TaxID=859144 RepID=UPI00082E6405|nr:Ig-like domain-containing protein [Cytobacillus gottheilii]